MRYRPLPRSAYAAKLREFSEFAFSEEEALARRGRWGEFFAQRMGGNVGVRGTSGGELRMTSGGKNAPTQPCETDKNVCPTGGKWSRARNFDGRIILEIGCSDAGLLTSVAGLHRATAFVGLDWKCKPLYEGASRTVSGELRNVALLRARAQEVGAIFGPAEVDEVWIFHPEPCEDPAEVNNRLIAEPFLEQVHQVLRDDGFLALKTDHREYFQWTLETLGSEKLAAKFRIAVSSSDYWGDEAAQARHRLFEGQMTTYEQRFVKKRQPIYYLELWKV